MLISDIKYNECKRALGYNLLLLTSVYSIASTSLLLLSRVATDSSMLLCYVFAIYEQLIHSAARK